MYTGTVNQFTTIENDTGSIEMAFFAIWLVFVLVLIILPIYVFIKYIKKDSDLKRKKEEKEIELMQTQIDYYNSETNEQDK